MGALADKYRAKTSLAAKYRAPVEPEGDPLDVLKPEASVGAAGRGLVQGATLGFGDEIMGGADTAIEAGKRAGQALGLVKPDVVEADPLDAPGTEVEKPSLADVYRKARDSYRQDNAKSDQAHPIVYGGTKLAGNLAVPIPGGTAAGLGGKVALGAAKGMGFGAALGAGESEKEDLGGIASDAAQSAELGAAGGAVGGALEAGAGRLAARFAGKADAARAAKTAADLAEELASAKGAYGQKVQDANRTLENLRNAIADPAIERGARQRITAFLDSPDGRALAQQVAVNSLENAPAKMGEMASLKAALADAPNAAAKKSQEYFTKSSLREDVLPRVAHYAKPAVSAAIGGVAGGPVGAAAGGLLGVAAGKPGRAIANLTQKTPRFTVQANEALSKGSIAAGEAAGRLAIEAGSTADDFDMTRDTDETPLEARFTKKKR